MIDALFGSKTRVKLLHLFLNNPGKAFYVREITRLVEEQINSVRRELANMLEVGIITNDSADNRLYYEINQRYEFYIPFRAIFADQVMNETTVKSSVEKNGSWQNLIKQLVGIRIAILAGVLVKDSSSPVDLLLVGDLSAGKLKLIMKQIEKIEGRELNYTMLSYDEFYYRLSVRDKFITEIIHGRHAVLIDTDNVLKLQ